MEKNNLFSAPPPLPPGMEPLNPNVISDINHTKSAEEEEEGEDDDDLMALREAALKSMKERAKQKKDIGGYTRDRFRRRSPYSSPPRVRKRESFVFHSTIFSPVIFKVIRADETIFWSLKARHL
jgi:hypothetical protein